MSSVNLRAVNQIFSYFELKSEAPRRGDVRHIHKVVYACIDGPSRIIPPRVVIIQTSCTLDRPEVQTP